MSVRCHVCGQDLYTEDTTAIQMVWGRVWMAHPLCAQRLREAAPEMAELLDRYLTFHGDLCPESWEDTRGEGCSCGAADAQALLVRIRGEA